VVPAIEQLIAENRKLLDELLDKHSSYTWENLIEPFEVRYLPLAHGQPPRLSPLRRPPLAGKAALNGLSVGGPSKSITNQTAKPHDTHKKTADHQQPPSETVTHSGVTPHERNIDQLVVSRIHPPNRERYGTGIPQGASPRPVPGTWPRMSIGKDGSLDARHGQPSKNDPGQKNRRMRSQKRPHHIQPFTTTLPIHSCSR